MSRQTITRRRMLTLAAGAAAPLALAACGQRGPAPTTGKVEGSFEFWQPWPIEQPTHGGPIGWRQLMDGFNERYTGRIKVIILTPGGEGGFETKVQTAFAAGTPPDGWQVSQFWAPIFAGKGFSAPLDDLMKRDKWDKSQIFPSALETMQWQGKSYAMMQHPDIVFMWYSTGLMEENGVDTRTLPASWRQLDELAVKMTKKEATGWDFIGLIPHIGTDWTVVFPQANGAKLVSDDGKKAQFDAPEVIDAIEWAKTHLKRLGATEQIDDWRRRWPGHNTPQGAPSGAADIFGHRKLAAVNGGNWFADNIRRLNRTMKFAVAPIPSGPRGPRDHKANVYSGGILEAARKGGPKLDLMWEFMKYTATKEGGLHVQRNTADVAASKEAARDPSIVNDPNTGLGRREFYTLFEQGSGSRTLKHPAANEINAEYNRPINAYLRDQIGNLRDELREANKIAQQRIDEYWATQPASR